MLIPEPVAPKLIGHHGENVKALQADTGAAVRVGPPGNLPERLVTCNSTEPVDTFQVRAALGRETAAEQGWVSGWEESAAGGHWALGVHSVVLTGGADLQHREDYSWDLCSCPVLPLLPCDAMSLYISACLLTPAMCLCCRLPRWRASWACWAS